MPLGKRADYGDSKFAGVQIPFAHDVASAMQVSVLMGLLHVIAKQIPVFVVVDACRYQHEPLAASHGTMAHDLPHVRGEESTLPMRC